MTEFNAFDVDCNDLIFKSVLILRLFAEFAMSKAAL